MVRSTTLKKRNTFRKKKEQGILIFLIKKIFLFLLQRHQFQNFMSTDIIDKRPGLFHQLHYPTTASQRITELDHMPAMVSVV